MRSRYSGAFPSGTGPISATLLPPRVEPPLPPRVNSQTFPAASVTREVGPSAACAWSSVGKFSTRQYSGPSGSCLSLFSPIGLTTRAGSATAARANDNIAVAQRKAGIGKRRDIVDLICWLRGYLFHGGARWNKGARVTRSAGRALAAHARRFGGFAGV